MGSWDITKGSKANRRKGAECFITARKNTERFFRKKNKRKSGLQKISHRFQEEERKDN